MCIQYISRTQSMYRPRTLDKCGYIAVITVLSVLVVITVCCVAGGSYAIATHAGLMIINGSATCSAASNCDVEAGTTYRDIRVRISYTGLDDQAYTYTEILSRISPCNIPLCNNEIILLRWDNWSNNICPVNPITLGDKTYAFTCILSRVEYGAMTGLGVCALIAFGVALSIKIIHYRKFLRHQPKQSG